MKSQYILTLALFTSAVSATHAATTITSAVLTGSATASSLEATGENVETGGIFC